jgi:hypothetical protein
LYAGRDRIAETRRPIHRGFLERVYDSARRLGACAVRRF